MIRKWLFLLVFVAFVQTSQAVVDLTPTPAEYTAEGITVQQLIFQHDKRKVSYEPPRLWSYRFDAGGLTLTPPALDRTHASIQVTPLAAPQLLDDKAMAALKQHFVATLPPGGQMVEVIGEELNPVSLDGSPSYAVTASYQALGETFLRSVVFVNLPDTQLTFQLTSRKGDFTAASAAFRRSIFTWHWLPSADGAAAVTSK